MTRNEQSSAEGIQIFDEIGFDSGIHVTDAQLEDFARKIIEGGIDARKELVNFKPLADEFQTRVIDTDKHTVRVVAPAGSGKTQTVVNRAIQQIKNGVNANRILILTFDKAAASSLSLKLQVLKDELATKIDVPEIKTLNAFGYGILGEFVPFEHKAIANASRLNKAISEIKRRLKEISLERYAALPRNITNSFYLAYFSLLKNQLFDPRNLDRQKVVDFIMSHEEESSAFFEDPGNGKKMRLALEAVVWLFEAQEACYEKNRIMDFDDQKLRAYASLISDNSLEKTIQNRYSEIVVDEFQDINKLDFEFIKVVAKNANLLVVGDDDQAIYGFRGCSPEYIINLEKHLGREVTTFELSKNYRCPRNIVEFADRLIQKNNPNRIQKKPVAVSEIDAKLKVVPSVSPLDEARKIVVFINEVRTAKSKKHMTRFGYENFAVLYRANSQSFPLQIEFIKRGIPYHVRDEDNILNNRTLKKILAILEVKLDIKNKRSSSVESSITTLDSYFKYITPIDFANLQTYFGGIGTFLDLVDNRDFWRIFPKAERSSFPAVIRELVFAKGLDQELEIISERFNNLRGLIGSLEDVAENRVPLGEVFDIGTTFSGDTREFLESMKNIMEEARRNNAGKDRNSGVALRTYFKAKGLQWDTVILTTCNEGLIPHKKAKVEDERRLFYVAITRASANLYISYVKNVSKNTVQPSEFLKEAGFPL